MSLRHDELTDEERARQDALDQSWAYAQQALADPAYRAELEWSIEQLDHSTAPRISATEFLAQTKDFLG